MSQWDFGHFGMRPARPDPFQPPFASGRPPFASGQPAPPEDPWDDEFGDGFSPISYERDEHDAYAYPQDAYAYPQDPAPPREFWPPLPQERRSPRRWLAPAAIVVLAAATGAAIVVLSSGGPTASRLPAVSRPGTAVPRTAAGPGTAGGAVAAPLTLAQAQQVVAAYTAGNNQANAQMSDAVLATIETGSSYTIDAGMYRQQRADGAKPYPAFGPAQAQYYLPREQAGYPHWFVAQVANADLATPRQVTGTEYLLFTQAAPGAPWLDAIEPYVLGGAAAPQIAVGTDGLATAVAADATSLAVAPAQLPAYTAASLDGGQGGPANPGNLADGLDQAFWHQELPAATVTDQHSAGGGPVFGLATTDGGALLFYTDAAQLTLTAPAGEVLHLTIPGYYSAAQAVPTAGLAYLEQFATYVPPRGGAGLRVVADYSGITASN